MDTNILRSFLTATRKGNISAAAEKLHISQSALSKQLKGLENELGARLYTRSSNGIRLTEQGILFAKRAKDITELAERAAAELSSSNLPAGNVYIGCAESYNIRSIARIIREFRRKYPLVHYHLLSGDTFQVTEKLERGLLDIGIIAEPPDLHKYESMRLPGADVWGVLMRRDDPLAKKEAIRAEDLKGLPLLASPQSIEVDFPRWCGDAFKSLEFVGTVNLYYNGSVFVREGDAYLMTFKDLAAKNDPELCFRPLDPPFLCELYLIYKKDRAFTYTAELLLEELRNECESI